jgi:hypothetical protein
MKKISLLTIVILFTFSSFAQTSGTAGSLTWSLSDNNTQLTVSGTGAIPDYHPLGTASPWESYSETITSIEIGEGVSRIGDNAFAECKNLVSVNLPTSVTEIGNWAFLRCESLTSIALPDVLESIGDYAFSDCSLIEITIPEKVTQIGNNAFDRDLSAIHVADANPVYSSEAGVLYNRDKTVLILYPTQKTETTFSIHPSVITINNNAFADCNYLTSVVIPENLAYIGERAFNGCNNLVLADIPANVRFIGEAAFANDYRLNSVSFPENLTTIEKGVFTGCWNLTSVVIPENVVSIGDYAFNSCALLASVTFSEGLERIGLKAFAENISLTSVDIPGTVTSIGYCAFAHCDGLTSVTIPEGVIDMDGSVFADCYNLKDIEVRWNTPLFVQGNLFENVDISQSTLYVPFGTKPLYDTAAVWQNFGRIIEKSPTDIHQIKNDLASVKPVSNGIAIETKAPVPVSVYTVLGQKVYQSIVVENTEIRLNKGIYIVKINNESIKINIQ